jgi:hypothetical protein
VSHQGMLRPLACLSMLPLPGCFTPSDVTPIIYVNPRAAQRLPIWFNKTETAPEPAKPAAARVHLMGDGEQLAGSDATGRPGDTVLENAEVVFVFARPEGGSDVAANRGDIVDAADAHARKDELGQMSTSVGSHARQVVESLTSGTEAEGAAWIEARGHAPAQARLAVTTRYTLHAPDRALLMETTVENTGKAPVELPELGDVIQWGGADTVAPGRGHGFAGPSSGPYVGAVGSSVSYAITSTEGEIDAVSGSTWTQTTQRKKVLLAAHERVSMARVFVVGARADTSSLVAELTMVAGQPVGAVKITIPGYAGGTTLELTPEGSKESITLREPFEGVLPLGRYWIAAPRGGPPIGPLDVRAEGAAVATVPAGPVE